MTRAITESTHCVPGFTGLRDSLWKEEYIQKKKTVGLSLKHGLCVRRVPYAASNSYKTA